MEVLLSSTRGFCAGVVRAIEVVELCLKKFGPPVYVKHQIVHNPYVVASLERKGAITVEDVEDIPEGSVVVFSAHGSAPEDFNGASARDLKVIDATCPLVTRVHNEARKYRREGRNIVLVGHRGHQEVRGTMGQAPAVGLNSLRTVPRNFPGRSGTREDSVFLCSPETAAASALTGQITDAQTI